MGGCLSELIEHCDNGNGGEQTIQLSELSTPVSLKVYQDIYHQVTGRTEKIAQRYSDNLLIEFSELEQLHHKIMQLCDIHNVVANNEVISIFHEKERKQQFTSFARFRSYNSNATRPTTSIALKYNFSIIPSGLPHPQEYVVTIRLTSRVAAINQLENEAPSFMRGRFFSFMLENTAEVSVEYADYIIARGFLEAFDEWIKGCNATPKIEWLDFLRRWTQHLPWIISTVMVFLLGVYAIQAIPEFFGKELNAEVAARFIVIYSIAAYILITLGNTAGGMIEDAIDSYPILSYLNLNRGDAKLIDEFKGRKTKVVYKLIRGAVLTIVLGVISAKLERLI